MSYQSFLDTVSILTNNEKSSTDQDYILSFLPTTDEDKENFKFIYSDLFTWDTQLNCFYASVSCTPERLADGYDAINEERRLMVIQGELNYESLS